MKLKVVNGLPKWVVDWTPHDGPRKRRFFDTKTAAQNEKDAIEKQNREAGEVWAALDAKDRLEIGLLMRRARDAGYTLRQACDFFEKGGSGAVTLLSIAYNNFMEERKDPKRGLSNKTLMALKSNVGRFVDGRENIPVARITRNDLVEYLRNPKWGPRTYNAYLTSLATFFRWCVKSDLLTKSPASSLDKIGKKQMPDLDVAPAVLNTEQCRRLLRATLEFDRGLIPYIVVGMFGGLRPMKEAGKLLREDVSAKLLMVRGASAKDRQRRYVDVHPTMLKWLKIALKSKAQFPPANLRRRFENVRERAGLIKRVYTKGKERPIIESTGWEQDCLRHTFASHYLPVHGAEKTIEQMGHGDYGMLFTHYRQLITKDEAERFWSDLAPENLIPTLFDPKTIIVDQVADNVAAQAGDAGVAHVVNVPPGHGVVGESISDSPKGEREQPHPESNTHGAPEKLPIAA